MAAPMVKAASAMKVSYFPRFVRVRERPLLQSWDNKFCAQPHFYQYRCYASASTDEQAVPAETSDISDSRASAVNRDGPSKVQDSVKKHIPKWITMRDKMREKYSLQDQNNVVVPSNTYSEASSGESVSKKTHNNPTFAEKYSSPSRTVTRIDSEKLINKFAFLRRRDLNQMEKVIDTRYGRVRLDKDNKPGKFKETSEKSSSDQENEKSGGQFDPSDSVIKELPSETFVGSDSVISTNEEQIKGNFIEEQFFPLADSGKQSLSVPTNLESGLHSKDVRPSIITEDNYIDDIYFGSINHEPEVTKPDNESDTCDNFIEEQFFGSSAPQTAMSDVVQSYQIPPSLDIQVSTSLNTSDVVPDESKMNTESTSHNVELTGSEVFDDQYFGIASSAAKKGRAEHVGHNVTENTKNRSDEFGQIAYSQKAKVEYETASEDKNIYVEGKTQKKSEDRVRADIKNPKTAHDQVVKMRLEKEGKLHAHAKVASSIPQHSKWRGALDSKGFRKLKGQVMDLQYTPEHVVVSMLRDGILYEDENIVAIDKPYGLPSHGGPGIHHSIGKLLPQLAKKLHHDLDTLHLVHRLDKETTGVMVLAKNEEMYHRLLGMFKRREVLKKYWVITKGVPNPLEGVIDIPMAEGTVGSQYRMALRPEYNKHTKLLYQTAKPTNKSDAITNFKVLDSEGSCALVECQPETGVKHQIRCHLAFGLNTPILGDHKYSHFSKLAPQKLHPDTLQSLGIRQATVRYLPMHLHAHLLVLPELKNGRNLFVACRLPKFFVQNMKWLKLKPPNSDF